MVMVSGAGGLQKKGGRSPPPMRGRLGGGRCICDTLLSPSACSTEGFFAEKRLSYPAQQGARKGFVKGEPVPLDPVLVSFAGAKETPRRRAVQIATLIYNLPRRRRVETMPRPSAGRRKKPPAGAGGGDCGVWGHCSVCCRAAMRASVASGRVAQPVQMRTATVLSRRHCSSTVTRCRRASACAAVR